MKLSILICTLPDRKLMLTSLLVKLNRQIKGEVDIHIAHEPHLTIGEKRNLLLENSTGEYVCFIDDDDDVSDNYIDLLMEGINKGVDCSSLKGDYIVDGHFDSIFEHSVKYKEWKTTDNVIKYERYPNHLNCIKSSIAKQFKFPEKNFGEDHDWSRQIHESGLIKTEHYIDQVIYYYKKVTK